MKENQIPHIKCDRSGCNEVIELDEAISYDDYIRGKVFSFCGSTCYAIHLAQIIEQFPRAVIEARELIVRQTIASPRP